jgi:hypothetical protein
VRRNISGAKAMKKQSPTGNSNGKITISNIEYTTKAATDIQKKMSCGADVLL